MPAFATPEILRTTAPVAHSIVHLVGNTPLLRLKHIERDFSLDSPLYAKLELMNPGGSVKDRIGYYMLQDALDRGLIDERTVIVEPTSGNTGIGLVLAAKDLGNPVVLVMPDKMSREKEVLLRALGANVVRTPTAVTPESPLSYYSVSKAIATRLWSLKSRPTPKSLSRILDEIEQLVKREDKKTLSRILARRTAPNRNAWIPNQYYNPSNPRAHEETTGPEIWQQTGGNIDILVAGMGTGGTITGVARFLRKKKPSVRIVGVDPQGSAYYHIKRGMSLEEAVARTHPYQIEGIGEDILPSTIDLDLVDEIVRVGDQQAFSMARYLAKREGVLAGSSSGAALYAAVKYLRENRVRSKTTVVILPDTGRNYLSKFYSDEWMQENGYSIRDEDVLEELGLGR